MSINIADIIETSIDNNLDVLLDLIKDKSYNEYHKMIYEYLEHYHSTLTNTQILMAYMQLKGIGVKKNTSEGEKILSQFCTSNNPYALLFLGMRYSKMKTHAYLSKAVNCLTIAINSKDNITNYLKIRAFNQLGLMFMNGQGTSKSYVKSQEYFLKAMDNTNPAPYYNMAVLMKRQTVIKDQNDIFNKQYIKLLIKAHLLGSKNAEKTLLTTSDKNKPLFDQIYNDNIKENEYIQSIIDKKNTNEIKESNNIIEIFNKIDTDE